jgi:ornithine cyclodeaminase/alanine dehydrogenase-like protein (mu-crystallin family)
MTHSAAVNREGPMLYLSAREAGAALAEIDPVAAVRLAFVSHAHGQSALPAEAYLGWETADGSAARSLCLPGQVSLDGFPTTGVKVINSSLANRGRSLRRASGLMLLVDSETARVTWVMAAAEISAVRTAAVTHLAAEACSATAPTSLAILGAGDLASAHLRLLVPRLQLARLRVYDIHRGRGHRLICEHQALLGRRGVDARVASSAEEAVSGSDLVVTTTTATDGYIPMDWLAPGSVLVMVSLDDARPEVVMAAERVFVDSWALVCSDERRLLGRMWRDGMIVGPHEDDREGARRVDGELGEILTGAKAPRISPDGVVLVNPFGMAIHDVAVAEAVARAALVLGLGRHLER